MSSADSESLVEQGPGAIDTALDELEVLERNRAVWLQGLSLTPAWGAVVAYMVWRLVAEGRLGDPNIQAVLLTLMGCLTVGMLGLLGGLWHAQRKLAARRHDVDQMLHESDA